MTDGRLPVSDGEDVVRARQRAGFEVDRVVGSHYVLTVLHDPKRTVTVPFHGGRELKHGTLRSFIGQARLTIEEFRRFL